MTANEQVYFCHIGCDVAGPKAVDTLINFETVKMFGMEDFEVDLFNTLQRKLLELSVKLRVSLNLLNFGQAFIRTTGVTIALCLAAVGAAQGRLTPGDFVLINAYILQLFQPLTVRDAP